MDLPIWQALLLGALQGLTEFLPISSSGHLALVQHYLPGFEQPGVLFDVVVHAGTLAAVLIYFAGDLKDLVVNIFRRQGSGNESSEGDLPVAGRRLLFGIIIASVPTGIIGLLLESRISALFQSVTLVGASLLATAAVLVGADVVSWRAGSRKPGDPGIWQSLLIGTAQGIAVIPGISRSGATIATGIMSGLEGRSAARFSFLIFIPAMLAALVMEVFMNLESIEIFSTGMILRYLLGAAVAMVVGYLCIDLLLRVVRRARLSYFAIYCVLVGTGAIIVGG